MKEIALLVHMVLLPSPVVAVDTFTPCRLGGVTLGMTIHESPHLAPEDGPPWAIAVPGKDGATVTYTDASWRVGAGVLTSRSLPDGRVTRLFAGPGVVLEVGSKSLVLGKAMVPDVPSVFGQRTLLVRCSHPLPGGPLVKELSLSFSCSGEGRVNGEISIGVSPSHESRSACGDRPTLESVMGMESTLRVLGASLAEAHSETTFMIRENSTDADVSRAALTALFPDVGSALVIEKGTKSRPLQASWVSAELHDIPPDALGELVQSYLERNQEVVQFQAGLLPEGAQVVATQELEKMFADDMETGWKQFRQRYGGATVLVSLSLPGYNLNRQYALIHVRQSSGPLAGESSILILRKVAQGVWRVVAEAQVATS